MIEHLTHDERARLHAAEQAAGTRSTARFVLVTAPVSDRYALFPLVYGAAAGLTVLGALALFLPVLPLRAGFFAAVIVFAGVSLLLDWLPLRLLSVPKKIKHAHARDMAHRAFAARVLAQSDHKPGIVLFVSLGERYVELVADRDVNLRIPQKTWDAVIADFTDTARKGRTADAIAAAIEDCAKVLETHYPAK